jgi:hypothetical protein
MPYPGPTAARNRFLHFWAYPRGGTRNDLRTRASVARRRGSPGLRATTVLNSVCANRGVFGYPDEERHPRDEQETGLKIA